MKKFLFCVLVAVIATFAAVSAYAQSAIKVKLNGNNIVSDVAPQIINGRTMVPVRSIFNALGAEVTYDKNTKTIVGTKNNTVVKMYVGKNYMYVNGISYKMDCEPVVVNGRALAPARYVAEGFGCTVSYDAVNKVVYITGNGKNSQGVSVYGGFNDVPDYGDVVGSNLLQSRVESDTITYIYDGTHSKCDDLTEAFSSYASLLQQMGYEYYSSDNNRSGYDIIYYNNRNGRVLELIADYQNGYVYVVFTITDSDGKLSQNALDKLDTLEI